MKPFVIESPCSESWDAMRVTGGAARHCASCNKHVFDLSRMTEAQIGGVVALTGGDFCGRQTIRGGELVTRAPAPVAKRWPLNILPSLQRGAVVASALAIAACDASRASPPVPGPAGPSDPVVIVVAGEPGPTSSEPTSPEPQPQPPEPPTVTPVAPDYVLAGGIRAPEPQPEGTVAFGPGATRVTKAQSAVLERIAAAMVENPWIGRVSVTGHARPSEGSAARRAALAKARAEAVKAALVKHGVDAARLVVRSGTNDSGTVVVRICEGDTCE